MPPLPGLLKGGPKREHNEQRRQQTLQLIADIAAEMDTAQQAHLSQALRDWAGEFESLACSVAAEPATADGRI
ncbi:MAG: hypothetical protein ACQETD_05535 [Pseudomonadota bacterium]